MYLKTLLPTSIYTKHSQSLTNIEQDYGILGEKSGEKSDTNEKKVKYMDRRKRILMSVGLGFGF